MRKFRLLTAREIECRVSRCTVKGVVLLLYKDARCDMNILDETVGAENWQRCHSRENANCTVSLWDEAKSQWIGKEDTGTESNTEAAKGLASDSFKRACFNWGIGRELYTAPFIWIPAGTCKVEQNQNGKWVCKDKFKVKAIEYTDCGEISALIIVNAKTGNVVFSVDMKAEEPAEKTPSSFPEPVTCENCGNDVKGVYGRNGDYIPGYQIAEMAVKKYGRNLCSECMKAAQDAKRGAADGT